MTTHKETRLSCGHIRLWPSHAPRIGDIVYCPLCNDTKTVSMVPGAYRAVCSLTCKWSIVRLTHVSTLKHVEKHLRDNPDHVIRVGDYLGNVSIVTYRQVPLIESLFD